jgi:hypothetical protein
MPLSDFIDQLKALGYDVTDHGENKVSFPYVVPVGKFADTAIRLGFAVPPDFNLTPPTGPHITPKLLPANPNAGPHPNHGVQDNSPFGSDWQYWSRPLQHWAQTQRTVKDVLAHVRHLFDTQ